MHLRRSILYSVLVFKILKSVFCYTSCSQHSPWAFLVAQTVKKLPAMQETWVRSLGREDPLVKEKAIHSSILAWRIPWTEKPGRLQSTGCKELHTNDRHFYFSLIHIKSMQHLNNTPFLSFIGYGFPRAHYIFSKSLQHS